MQGRGKKSISYAIAERGKETRRQGDNANGYGNVLKSCDVRGKAKAYN